MTNHSIDEFFSEATINEFQLIEEDVTIMKKILRRYLVFSAKKTVEELEKIQPPPEKRARFRHHEDQDKDQDQDQAQPEAQPADPPPVQQPAVEQQPNHEIDNFFADAEAYIEANPSLGAQVDTIYSEISALAASTTTACSICGQLFNSIKELRKHLSYFKCTEESLITKKVTCPTCGKFLHCRRREIELHHINHIPTVKRPVGRPKKKKTAEVKF